MVRAHVHDQLRTQFTVWGAENPEEARGQLETDQESGDTPPPVVVVLAADLKEGMELCTALQQDALSVPPPVLLLVESPDVPKTLSGLPEDVIRGRYDRTDLCIRVRSLGMLAKARWETARRDAQVREAFERVEQWRQTLEEERAFHEMLARFVSPAVSDAVRSGVALQPPLRLELSVLFSDIRGFTDATAFSSPDDTIDLLNDYLPEVNRIIANHGGYLDKFMGDGILAYFAPRPQTAHSAERAVRAAIAVQERLEELKVTWFERGFLPVGIGVGITTGMVTLGTIGAGERLDFTVIGSSVNLAARLQGLARGGDIIIDEPTYQRIKQTITVQQGRRVPVKGFEEPVLVYSVAYLESSPAPAGSR